MRRRFVTSQDAKPGDAFAQHPDQEQSADPAKAGAGQIRRNCRNEKRNGDEMSHRFSGARALVRPDGLASRLGSEES